MEIFKQASKMKLRFKTVKGSINLEDLWDLPLTSKDYFSLDAIAKDVNRTIKTSEEESFVTTKSTASKTDELRLNILKEVIKAKLDEAEESTNRVEKADRKKKLLAAIANKQDETLTTKSVEELQTELAELG